jgi:hypothetical protein
MQLQGTVVFYLLPAPHVPHTIYSLQQQRTARGAVNLYYAMTLLVLFIYFSKIDIVQRLFIFDKYCLIIV